MDTSSRSTFDRLHALVTQLGDRLAWLPPLLARVALGVVFVGTGWGKLHNLAQLTQFFASLGIPAASVQAPLVAGIELIGGLMLVVGLGTRLAALPLAGTMVVAILTAQWPNVHGVADLFGLLELAYLLVFVWLAVQGPGKLSLDHALLSWRARRSPAAAPAMAAV